MLSKKASFLLLLGISVWLLSFLVHEITYAVSYGAYRTNLMSWISMIVYILTPVTLILIAVAGLKQNFRNLKTAGILITVASSLSIGFDLYLEIDFLLKGDVYFREEEFRLTRIVMNWVGFLPSVSVLLLGIALIGTRPLRRKRAAMWLIAGGLISLFSQIGYCTWDLLLDRWSYVEPNTWQTAADVMIWIKLLYPVGLIAVGLSVVKHSAAVPSASSDILETSPGELPAGPQPAAPRVIDWFESYLLSGIPVAGPVLLFIWGIDRSNRVRRNWALTFFLALILRTLLNLIVFVPYVLFSDIGYLLHTGIDESSYMSFAWTTVFGLIIVGALLLILHFSFKPDVNDPEDLNPSVSTWVSNFLILAVPLVGIICLIVWATDNRNDIIRRWAAARLLWGAVILVLSLYMYLWILEILRLNQFTFFQF